ncbi:MAG: penicillin-binding protein 1C [Burkholderiales bacterium]|nr:penicillin-binding protein 1C [Burkholderiales bacterium]
MAGTCVAAAPPPSFAEVKRDYVASDALLLDRMGSPLASLRVDTTIRRLEWVTLGEVSPAMSAALIAAEDQHFYEHEGVDWTGLAVAAWDSLWRYADARRPRGGSTLTMQLASLVDPALRPQASEPRTLAQKWAQIEAARALERGWTKEEILEAYLNLSSYRGELAGLRAAAGALFGKAPSGLDARESAILVALLRAPAARSALVTQRACAVAAVASPEVACEAIRALASVSLAGARLPASRDIGNAAAPHLAARLLDTPGERLTTTLDGDVQAFAVATLRAHLTELAARNVEDGAIVVLDNASGDVVAYVGSSGELSRAAQVDGVVAPRQAGSTLKPFLYALALDDRLLTAASLVDDSPLAIATARGVYAPQNYDRDFRGSVSLRTALASSLNVPAVRTLDVVGPDRFREALASLGFATLTESADHYGAALALGGAEVTLLALTNAYRTLANGGIHAPPRMRDQRAQVPARRLFGAQASFIIADILADRSARAATFGLDNPLATRVWSAVKTGTSKDMRDNWCVGFTSRYTVGVWVGNFSGAPMHDVSGVTGAAPVWRDIVHYLHRAQRSQPPAPPAGVVARTVSFAPAVERARREWFLPGTDAATMRGSARRASGDTDRLTPRIRYPAPDTVIALDPDIPAAHQRVAFVAAPARADLRWQVDGVELDEYGARVLWPPTSGKHQLVLRDARGEALAQVGFEVRGWHAR